MRTSSSSLTLAHGDSASQQAPTGMVLLRKACSRLQRSIAMKLNGKSKSLCNVLRKELPSPAVALPDYNGIGSCIFQADGTGPIHCPALEADTVPVGDLLRPAKLVAER